MLKNDIGINAGVIWQFLEDKERLTIREIVELTKFDERLVILSLGWLSRENKIQFSSRNEMTYIELISPFSEIFY